MGARAVSRVETFRIDFAGAPGPRAEIGLTFIEAYFRLRGAEQLDFRDLLR